MFDRVFLYMIENIFLNRVVFGCSNKVFNLTILIYKNEH